MFEQQKVACIEFHGNLIHFLIFSMFDRISYSRDSRSEIELTFDVVVTLDLFRLSYQYFGLIRYYHSTLYARSFAARKCRNFGADLK